MDNDQLLLPNISIHNGYQVASARFVSDLGAFLNMVALSSYVFWLTNSSIYVGIFLALRVAGGICASLIATTLFRQFSGPWPLVGFDLVRGATLGMLLIIPAEFHMPLLFIIAYILGLNGTLFSVGLNSQLVYFDLLQPDWTLH